MTHLLLMTWSTRSLRVHPQLAVILPVRLGELTILGQYISQFVLDLVFPWWLVLWFWWFSLIRLYFGLDGKRIGLFVRTFWHPMLPLIQFLIRRIHPRLLFVQGIPRRWIMIRNKRRLFLMLKQLIRLLMLHLLILLLRDMLQLIFRLIERLVGIELLPNSLLAGCVHFYSYYEQVGNKFIRLVSQCLLYIVWLNKGLLYNGGFAIFLSSKKIQNI